jgi:hypothetical protein
VLTIFSYALLLSGCAQWAGEYNNPESQPKLPALQLAPDCVTVETVLVRFPLESEVDLQNLWTQADESVLDIELRRRLDKNGMRAGIILGELPEAIRRQLLRTSQEQLTDALEYAGLAADVDNKMRKLQCRAGRRKDFIVRREVAEPLTVISSLDGRVFGETFQSPTVLFDLRVKPHANGQATIELTPEIQHGEQRQSYVSTEFGVRPEMRRSQTAWQELAIHARLSQGQVLMVAGTLPPKAIGRALFMTKTADQSDEHVVLLVRLAATQLDELFMPEILEQAHALTER